MHQTSIEELRGMLLVGDPRGGTIYWRRSNFLDSTKPIDITADIRVLKLTTDAAERLVLRRKKKVSAARAGRDRDFYTRRVRELAGATVMEVRASGWRDSRAERTFFRAVSESAEDLLVTTSMLVHGRQRFLKILGASPISESHMDLLIRPGYEMLSTSKEAPASGLLAVTANVARRLDQSRLKDAGMAISSDSTSAERLRQALRWIRDSAIEPSPPASVVKLATGLETLLIQGREPITSTLAERSAYCLSDDPEERAMVSAAVRRLYDIRSDVVHGAASCSFTPKWFNAAFFMATAVFAVIASNSKVFQHGMARWTNSCRWGRAAPSLIRPSQSARLRKACQELSKK